MRNAFPGLCLVMALVLAAVCVLLSVQKTGLEKRVNYLQGTIREKETAELNFRAKLEKLTRQREAFKRRAEMLAADMKTNRLSFTAIASGALAAKADKTPGVPADNSARGTVDPETRKSLREQREAALNAGYAQLFKTLALSAGEIEKFKTLLLDQEMKNADRLPALLKLAQDPAAQTNVLKAIAQDKALFEDKVKALLGDTRYAGYQDYNQTVGQRAALDQFSQQLAGGETALVDQQSQQLLQIMTEEQRGMPGFYNPDDTASLTETVALQGMTDERLNDLFSAMQEADQRVLQRAADVLTANQLQALAVFLSSELQAQGAVMAQARISAGQRAP